MWNCNLDVNTLISNFFDKVYREASDIMEGTYWAWRLQSAKQIELGRSGSIYASPHAAKFWPQGYLTTQLENMEAAKAAKIDAFIRTLPEGYDTVMTDNGVNISKGQKQLITIARAMLADSPMLILDEATSNVDSRTEIMIQEAMLRLMQGRTCFVIAHRLSTVQNADTILVVKDGNVIEQGNHEALMRLGGTYAGLYNSQFS